MSKQDTMFERECIHTPLKKSQLIQLVSHDHAVVGLLIAKLLLHLIYCL